MIQHNDGVLFRRCVHSTHHTTTGHTHRVIVHAHAVTVGVVGRPARHLSATDEHLERDAVTRQPPAVYEGVEERKEGDGEVDDFGDDDLRGVVAVGTSVEVVDEENRWKETRDEFTQHHYEDRAYTHRALVERLRKLREFHVSGVGAG